jgi:hypothetical protein
VAGENASALASPEKEDHDEMIFALPGDKLPLLGDGLDKAGRTLGAKYPVPFYQNFQPEFPGMFKELADEAGLVID